eukprot:CAMPEP_0171996528 /NCGR_PEP_ID=MMETSP1041-20130122/174_1 /TAXON_ID=464988 /ORGANISM="Hemiselmis andersenii, Strain CCMP439" /LENGTH=44 /DNA_ID= /DNA_START= /DNA_END= /DNA_ORIENTATION=
MCAYSTTILFICASRAFALPLSLSASAWVSPPGDLGPLCCHIAA